MRYFLYCRKSTEDEARQVMSIESQRSELERAFGARDDITIVATLTESKSAMSPGRAIFADMIARIEKGEAEGIIAWAPDRLARNSIDGGRIVYLLDCGAIRDLKFYTYTFENNPQGKFMLSIMFGQSKYYSDALSENVKRGNRTKLAKGWRPNQAPLGYLNDPETKTIVKDPERFPLIRRMFEMMLTGTHTATQIARIARDEWGLRTPKRKRSGGRHLALCSIYRIFHNPFYAGTIRWSDGLHPGRHTPLVTKDEFNAVQRQLARTGKPRPQRYSFPYAGLIRCGACGLRVTAEHKRKPSGRNYIYYHCSRGRPLDRCQEPSVEARELDRQIIHFLTSLRIDPGIEAWIRKALEAEVVADVVTDDAKQASALRAIAETEKELRELTGLRLRGLLTDQEFIAERTRLQSEEMRLKEKHDPSTVDNNTFEPVLTAISFCNQAAEWFATAENDLKRQIVKTAFSNPTLKAKILSIDAAKPFLLAANFESFGGLRGVSKDVRTDNDNHATSSMSYLHEMRTLLAQPEYEDFRNDLRSVCDRFAPAPEIEIPRLRKSRAGNPGY